MPDRPYRSRRTSTGRSARPEEATRQRRELTASRMPGRAVVLVACTPTTAAELRFIRDNIAGRSAPRLVDGLDLAEELRAATPTVPRTCRTAYRVLGRGSAPIASFGIGDGGKRRRRHGGASAGRQQRLRRIFGGASLVAPACARCRSACPKLDHLLGRHPATSVPMSGPPISP